MLIALLSGERVEMITASEASEPIVAKFTPEPTLTLDSGSASSSVEVLNDPEQTNTIPCCTFKISSPDGTGGPKIDHPSVVLTRCCYVS